MNREAELAAALDGLVDIVERVGCGDWRNERGQRLKDTKQWVVAYLAATKKAQPAAPVPAQPAVVQDAVVRALIEAAQMAVEMIETNAHERRHVRWALKDAILSATDTEVKNGNP